MKRFRLIYTTLATAALMAFAACQSEDTVEQDGEQPVPVEPVKYRVGVRISPAGGFGNNGVRTRAWTDGNAETTDAEMMKLWTIIVTDGEGNVKAIHASKPTTGEGSEQEIDGQNQVDDVFNLPGGTYKFYSFANMAPSAVFSLMGISATESSTSSPVRTRDGDNGNGDPTTGGEANNDNQPASGNERPKASDSSSDPFYENPQYANDNVTFTIPGSTSGEFTDAILNDNTVAQGKIIAYTPASGAKITSPDGKTAGFSARGFDPTNVDDSPNIYGVAGIPMTNVQTINIPGDTNIDLVVVRTYAKIQLQVYNETGQDITIKSVKFSDITRSVNDNYKLLPATNATGGEITTMDVEHGTIQPNLNTTITGKSVFSYTPSSPVTVSGTGKTVADNSYVPITFYINESSAPTNLFGKFFIALEIDKGSGNPSEYRYALISGTNKSGETGSWDYIARNDFRIIPIVLDDYKLDIIPYDFPAIGVYPASVKEEDGLYTINFHDYGHFHLLPKVTKVSTGDAVPFAATAPSGTYGSTSWGLVGDSFSSSWSSWTDATKTTAYFNESAKTAFYRKGYSAASWTPVDGDEVGGEPQWYVNTDTNKPQWDPNASGTYNPFILGYIADPGAALVADRKVYHEFSIYLYKEGMSAPRQMTYRLLMILDKDQMSYARQRYGRTARRTHH